METDIIIMYAKQYRIVDNNGTNEGTSVYWCNIRDMQPKENRDGSKGARLAKANLSYADMALIKKAPAVYSVVLGMSVNAQQKQTIVIEEILGIKDEIELVMSPAS